VVATEKQWMGSFVNAHVSPMLRIQGSDFEEGGLTASGKSSGKNKLQYYQKQLYYLRLSPNSKVFMFTVQFLCA
jgi:hypothetical protein